MAVRYAVATGNWSNTATWNGGTLPTSADDVYSNTFTVTIDQDVTVLSLRNTSNASPAVTAGGGFACSTARTIDCSAGSGFYASGLGGLISFTHASGTTVTTKGTIVATTGATCFTLSSTGTTNHTGTVNGTGSNAAIYVSGAHTVVITGSVIGSTSANAILLAAACNLTVVGNVSSNSTSGSTAIYVNAAASVSITGNVTSTAGSASNGTVWFPTGAASVSIIGTISTSGSIPSVNGNVNATLTASGPFISSATGVPPIACFGPVKLTGIANNEFRFAKSTGGTTSLYSGDVTSGSPSAADVRYGTTFGVGGAYTGTLRVPAAASVAYGALVDATTGTAALSPADVAALVGAQITAALNSTP